MPLIKSIEKVEISFSGASTTQGLTLSQDPDYCVPFASWSITNMSGDFTRTYLDIWVSSGPTLNLERTTGSSTVYATVYVVEFDPSVNVQSGTFTYGGTSSSSAITAVDTASAFAMVYYRFTSGGTQYFYQVTSRARLTSTTVEYDRANSTGTITGHYFVVEDTEGYFSVTHEDVDIINPATSATTAISSVDDGKSFLIASYKNYYGARSAQYSTVSVWMTGPTQLRSEQFLNSGYPADSYIRAQVITFLKGGLVQRGQQSWTNSDTFDEDTLSPTVDLETTIANIPITQSTQKNNTAGDALTYTAWFDAEITNTSTIRIDRQGAVTGSEGTVAWEAITWPSTLYYFDGYVQEYGVGVDRTVRVHRRDTGEAVGETTSSGIDGYFYLETSYSGTQYLICLDDLAGESFNAIVYDLMVPTASG